MKYLLTFENVEELISQLTEFFNSLRQFYANFGIESIINPVKIGGTIPTRISLKDNGGTIMMIKAITPSKTIPANNLYILISWHGVKKELCLDWTKKLFIVLNIEEDTVKDAIRDLKLVRECRVAFHLKEIKNINYKTYSIKMKSQQFDL